MQQHVNSQQYILLHTVRNQNIKPILHLKFFIMTCNMCGKYVFLQNGITATCKLQNIYNIGCKLLCATECEMAIV